MQMNKKYNYYCLRNRSQKEWIYENNIKIFYYMYNKENIISKIFVVSL